MESPYRYFARVADEAEAKGWTLDLATTSVLAYILASARHGVATAGRKAIAAFYGLTERQVRNGMDRLTACGAIERMSPRSCAVLVNVDPEEASPAKMAPPWPQMIFNNCNFVDCQIDRAAATLAESEGVKGLTDIKVDGNQIVIKGGKIVENEERPERGQDGRETVAEEAEEAVKRDSPHTPYKEKTEEYIYSNTPLTPQGGKAQTAKPFAHAPATDVEAPCQEGEEEKTAEEAPKTEVEAMEAEVVTGESVPCAPRNETRGAKNGLEGQNGAVIGTGLKSPRKTASKSLFANCAEMMALADNSPCGGDPVPNAARLNSAYPDWAAKGVNLAHYWLAAYLWSDQKNQQRTPRGWKSTLSAWMARDEAEGKLAMMSDAVRLAPGGDAFEEIVAAVRGIPAERERERLRLEADLDRYYGPMKSYH